MRVLRVAFFAVSVAVLLAGCSLPPPQKEAPSVGQPAPAFELEATGRRKVTLDELKKDSAAVLVFYRGEF